jgi:cold shock CspA family protein
MSFHKSKLTRIGVFYDGNYFFHVSNYYQYQHARKARISIDGLHEFIRHQVSEAEGEDVKYCQIVDAHYFRGRPRAQEAEARGLLLRERQFDDILMREGVITHYLPLGPDGEKGIDVWLALETYELAIYKRFDVIVLIACDGDFLPLVRKLNALGARVMLLGWGFSYIDQSGKDRETRTAQVLLEEVTYPVLMHQIIDDRSRRGDPRIDQLFVPHKESGPYQKPMEMRRSQSIAPPSPASAAIAADKNVNDPPANDLTMSDLIANGVTDENLSANGYTINGQSIQGEAIPEFTSDPTQEELPGNNGAKASFSSLNEETSSDLSENEVTVTELAASDVTTGELPVNDLTSNLPTDSLAVMDASTTGITTSSVSLGRIQALREGFGFITPSDGAGNLFFFHASVLNADFNELRVGDEVSYKIGNNDKGICAVDVEIVT